MQEDRNQMDFAGISNDALGSINMFQVYRLQVLHIELQNCGLGPMIITKFEIIQGDRLISKNWIMETIIYAHKNDVKPHDYRNCDFSFLMTTIAIIGAKDEKLTLIENQQAIRR